LYATVAYFDVGNTNCVSYRSMAIRLGQILVDTKRLNVVNAEQTFRDESHLFLEIGPVSYRGDVVFYYSLCNSWVDMNYKEKKWPQQLLHW